MSETRNQTSLAGGTVTEQPASPDDEEQQARNGTLPGVEPESDSRSDQLPAEESDAQAQEGGKNADSSEQSDEETKGSLSEFGVEENHRPNNPKLANPDGNLEQDRRVNKERDTDVGEQEQLFPDVEDDQMTLSGERARNQCLF